MDISPNDIRNYEFSTQMRGYSKDDVDSFLDNVADAMETVKQENLKLSMEVDSLKTQLSGLRQFEDTIKSAAIDARRNADMTMANAKEEADQVLSEARAEAERLVESKEQELKDIEGCVSKAGVIKKSYLSQLRSLIASHLEIVENLSQEKSMHAEDGIEVTDSSEMQREQMETVGTEPSDQEPDVTEEANAADKIVSATPETEEGSPHEPGDKDEASEQASKPIDPELAVALENYQQKLDGQPKPSESAQVDDAIPSQPGEIVETTLRAEDIPPGFIAKDTDDQSEKATGKMTFDAADSAPETDSKSTPSLLPDNLADELDKVAAKFEEEMDKAAKS